MGRPLDTLADSLGTLRDCRALARVILGDEYATKMVPYCAVVAGYAREHGVSLIGAVTAIVEKAIKEGESEDAARSLLLFLTAAAADEMERA